MGLLAVNETQIRQLHTGKYITSARNIAERRASARATRGQTALRFNDAVTSGEEKYPYPLFNCTLDAVQLWTPVGKRRANPS